MAALRTSLIWHDEVMADVVSERPQKISIGPHEGATFLTPQLGLPDGFAIVRPGSRGHLLTLGGEMRGTVCIGGVEQDVAQLVREGDAGFHATAIGGLDWGVIELDATGKYKLFFAFVALDEVPVKPMFEADLEQRASFAFSMVLHAAVIFGTYQLYVHTESPIDAQRDFTINYVATRIDRFDTPAPRPAAAAPPAPTDRTIATPMPTPWHEPDATQRDRPVKGIDPAKQPGPKGPLDAKTQQLLDQLRGGIHNPGVDQLAHTGGEQGGGPVGGIELGGPRTKGTDDKPGGGPKGQYKQGGTPGGLDTGGLRTGTLCTGAGCGGAPVDVTPLGPPTHEEDQTLTAKEIDDVIKAARGRLTVCYQREVNRDPTLSGTVQVKFEIGADGGVKSAKVTASTVRSEVVSDCLTRAIGFLHFPAKGRAIVNYPFVFASH
ncbi:MAG: AgmX/PglI C-terminal domain-containing protein [Kofleriaceae bacterium]